MNFKGWKSSSPFVLPAFLSFSILFYDDIPAGVMDVCRTLLSIIEQKIKYISTFGEIFRK